MIIKSVYISHFGCLRGKFISFEKRINVISMPNESGKSTIAEFIRVMLYGVTSNRFNQRKKYMPFGSTSMSGEMNVELDGREYIIKRTFGMRKADDTISVIDAVSGAEVKEYSVDCPGFVMCGINGDSYENTCYIKQLSSKIDNSSAGEIQNKLLNLTQNSDEEYSYRNAMGILDSAVRELEGPKGKIKATYAILNDLALKKSSKVKIKEELEKTEILLKQISGEGNGVKENKLFWLVWVPVFVFLCLAMVLNFKALFAVLTIFSFCFALWLTLREKKKTLQYAEKAKQRGFYESKRETLRKQYEDIDISQIEIYKQKLEKYNVMLNDLNTAKDALTSAFQQLQMDYSPKLNSIACRIFKNITDGKYVEFKVDDQYGVKVRDCENNLVSGEYLSGGTYDQIYFSLRMALVELLGGKMPLILDDAFALYDDARTKKAIEYLKNTENQVLLFSCQTREMKLKEEC